MGATVLRMRAWARTKGSRLVVVALLVGVAAGAALAVVDGARRTATAPARYTAAVGGDPDLTLLQQYGPPLDDAVAQLPGVRAVASQSFVTSFLVSPTDGSLVDEPNPFAGDPEALGALLVEGRMPDLAAPEEFIVNRSLAALLAGRFGTRVGDTFDVASYDQEQVAGNFTDGDAPRIPPFPARLVGIVRSPTEVDDRTPSMLFPRSFLDAHPDVGVVQTGLNLRLDGGVDPRRILDAVRAMPFGADASIDTHRVVSPSVRRAVRFQATALWLIALLTVVAALVVVATLVSRAVRTDEVDRRSLQALGWRRADLALERGIEAVAIAVLAAPVAALLSIVASRWFPIGALAVVEPHRGARVDWAIVGLGVLALVLAAPIAPVAQELRHRSSTPEAHRSGMGFTWLARATSDPTLCVGSWFAGGRRGRRGGMALAAPVLGIAGLVAAAVVGASLTHIVDDGDRWGENYTHVFGNPYAPAVDDVVGPIAQMPEVASAMGISLSPVIIDGIDVAAVGFRSAKGGLAPIVLRGRLPSSNDEIGLGDEVLHRLRVDIGDEVEVVGATGQPARASVVGVVVTPDKAGAGAVLPFDAFKELNPMATLNVVLASFRPGTADDVIAAVAAANYTPPEAIARPASVTALSRVTAAPGLFALVMGLLLAVGGAYATASSVGAHRHDLAVLSSLGATRRQLRRVVRWQTSVVMAIVLALGVIVGVGIGRLVVASLTDALGVVPGVTVPVLLLVAGAACVGVAANALATVAARRVIGGRAHRSLRA